MNIFVLSDNVKEVAEWHLDKHCVKMPLESAQMLCTALHIHGGQNIPYKPAHVKHPCTLWTAQSRANFQWLCDLGYALCDEYTYRYGKVHATDTLLREKLKQLPRNIEVGPLTQQPLAMKANPECMHPNDPVRSYREFYQTKQGRFKMAWTKREVPEWFTVK